MHLYLRSFSHLMSGRLGPIGDQSCNFSAGAVHFHTALKQMNQTFLNQVFPPSPVVALQREFVKEKRGKTMNKKQQLFGLGIYKKKNGAV